MSVIDWDSKPYPWNELGKEWVEVCASGFTEPFERRPAQESTLPLPGQRKPEKLTSGLPLLPPYKYTYTDS